MIENVRFFQRWRDSSKMGGGFFEDGGILRRWKFFDNKALSIFGELPPIFEEPLIFDKPIHPRRTSLSSKKAYTFDLRMRKPKNPFIFDFGAAISKNPPSSFFGAEDRIIHHLRSSTPMIEEPSFTFVLRPRKSKNLTSSIFGAKIWSKIAIGPISSGILGHALH